jgi:hypothetical protein
MNNFIERVYNNKEGCDIMGILDALPEELRAAFDDYVEVRKKHEDLVRRKDDFPSVKDWQQVVRDADQQRRAFHNKAARLLITYGIAPRLEDTNESLQNARTLVKEFLGLQ